MEGRKARKATARRRKVARGEPGQGTPARSTARSKPRRTPASPRLAARTPARGGDDQLEKGTKLVLTVHFLA